ncbi:MAG: hypothetical protein AAF961_11760, partial [Planctomycetota bacterium]
MRFTSATCLTALVVFWAALAAIFDADCLFEYLPRVLFGVVAAATLLVFAAWQPRAAVASAIFICAWLLVLSPIRWNHLKAFYIDSHSLQEGMRMDGVRRIMASYVEVGNEFSPQGEVPLGIFRATMAGVSESQQEHESRILFIPSEEYYADWCVVYPENGIVK